MEEHVAGRGARNTRSFSLHGACLVVAEGLST